MNEVEANSQTNRARNTLHRRELILEGPGIPHNPRHAHDPIVGYTSQTVSQGGGPDQFKHFIVLLACDLGGDVAV